ncbi:MAG: RluA family pseudouridine synthase [Bdellovibrionales bacterium]|nr:RluA family pseudouridine synthase [Bdellovibrionales bacterium]
MSRIVDQTHLSAILFGISAAKSDWNLSGKKATFRRLVKTQRIRFQVPADARGRRLDHVIFDYLDTSPGGAATRSAIRAWIIGGKVRLGDRIVKIPTRPMRPGDWISFDLDERARNPRSADVASIFSEKWIRFEDDDVIVVDKPAGLPTQPTLDPMRPNLFSLLKDFRALRKDSEPYVGLHHRLDRDTSGLVLFTKRKEANAGVASLFKDHRIQKTYWALCVPAKKGSLATQKVWQVKNFLKKVMLPGKKNVMRAVKSGGDLAITDFKILDDFSQAFLVQARPLTGRMHQIRAHLQQSGSAIFGDWDYGYQQVAGVDPKTRVMLHAHELEFDHPISGKPMKVKADVPGDMSALIEKMKKG